ncbi:MAG: histidine kinase [Bacteroidetes bacterium GWF2_33_16]|nr:MAG: histidine kinase [Bacteroidetes bacterium GWE2_32_14]OFY07035.1 MAG: histidine kinase [Bacteroidetes bacterium GWF2_33_16]
MDKKKKQGRYERIYDQLQGLMIKTDDYNARMSTIIAVLHHKMEYFFWTGFYFLKNEKLIVGQYQGPVACQELKKDSGVCWAGINQKKAIVVADVEKFPGHIACDSRSKSEIVIPLKDKSGHIIGVLDVDSNEYNSFDEIDELQLTKILELIYI